MTFPAELENMLKTEPDAAVFAISRNHADAILGLVRAAENLRDVKGRYHTEQATLRLFEALAELYGEGK